MRHLSILLVIFFIVACSQTPEPVVETAVPTLIPSPTTTPTELILPTAAPTETAVPHTPTPFPTPTNTPVPTPIIYQIQEGETLLGIAIAQGTTTEAILALNPDLRPEALQIGQSIILPAQESASTNDEAITVDGAALSDMQITQLQTYDTPVGGFWGVGEIENSDEQAVENVQVEIRFLDDAGNVVDTAVTWSAVPIIKAGTTAPFGLLLPQRPSFAQIDAAVIGGNAVAELGERYIDLEVTEIVLNNENPATGIEGVVQNVGSETAVSVQLILTLYDAEQQVVGFIIRVLDGELPAGADMVFTETAVSLGAPVESVSSTLFAYKLPVQNE